MAMGTVKLNEIVSWTKNHTLDRGGLPRCGTVAVAVAAAASGVGWPVSRSAMDFCWFDDDDSGVTITMRDIAGHTGYYDGTVARSQVEKQSNENKKKEKKKTTKLHIHCWFHLA